MLSAKYFKLFRKNGFQKIVPSHDCRRTITTEDNLQTYGIMATFSYPVNVNLLNIQQSTQGLAVH